MKSLCTTTIPKVNLMLLKAPFHDRNAFVFWTVFYHVLLSLGGLKAGCIIYSVNKDAFVCGVSVLPVQDQQMQNHHSEQRRHPVLLCVCSLYYHFKALRNSRVFPGFCTHHVTLSLRGFVHHVLEAWTPFISSLLLSNSYVVLQEAFPGSRL